MTNYRLKREKERMRHYYFFVWQVVCQVEPNSSIHDRCSWVKEKKRRTTSPGKYYFKWKNQINSGTGACMINSWTGERTKCLGCSDLRSHHQSLILFIFFFLLSLEQLSSSSSSPILQVTTWVPQLQVALSVFDPYLSTSVLSLILSLTVSLLKVPTIATKQTVVLSLSTYWPLLPSFRLSFQFRLTQ